jgi:hypothetical protein
MSYYACRDPKKCFTHGQHIKHVIGKNIWIGVYDSSNNAIIHNGRKYQRRSPLNQFVMAHYESMPKNKRSTANAWQECECEINGLWRSTYNLRPNNYILAEEESLTSNENDEESNVSEEDEEELLGSDEDEEEENVSRELQKIRDACTDLICSLSRLDELLNSK